jgi:hydrogenase maturation protease
LGMTGKNIGDLMRIAVIGYGNPGRADDGLGPALTERLEKMGLEGLTLESDYQLTLEHAAIVAEHDVVIFADAASDADAEYYLRPLDPLAFSRFASHDISPAEILGLAQSCFGSKARGYVLGIRASVLDRFEERLSPEGLAALDAAFAAVVCFIMELRAAGAATTSLRR